MGGSNIVVSLCMAAQSLTLLQPLQGIVYSPSVTKVHPHRGNTAIMSEVRAERSWCGCVKMVAIAQAALLPGMNQSQSTHLLVAL